MSLHLLTGGGAKLRVTVSKQEFFIPVVLLLKATRQCTDAEIYSRVLGGAEDDSYVSDRLQAALREHMAYDETLYSPEQCLAFLGARFRPVLKAADRLSDVRGGRF